MTGGYPIDYFPKKEDKGGYLKRVKNPFKFLDKKEVKINKIAKHLVVCEECGDEFMALTAKVCEQCRSRILSREAYARKHPAR